MKSFVSILDSNTFNSLRYRRIDIMIDDRFDSFEPDVVFPSAAFIQYFHERLNRLVTVPENVSGPARVDPRRPLVTGHARRNYVCRRVDADFLSLVISTIVRVFRRARETPVENNSFSPNKTNRRVRLPVDVHADTAIYRLQLCRVTHADTRNNNTT